jgi:hypothetical protein
MSLDFLRRLAFDGALADFIRTDPYQFGERATGIGLKFNPEFLDRVSGWTRTEESIDNWYDRQDFGRRLATALAGWEDESWLGFYAYSGDDRRKIVQIVVDIRPGVDKKFVSGRREYEGFPIVYREMGPIEAHYAPGDCLQSPSGGRGTLCGFLTEPQGSVFALTSGHVASSTGASIGDGAGRWPSLGTTRAMIVPGQSGPGNRYAAPEVAAIDAALVEVNANSVLSAGSSRVVEPISAISPGDLVEFVGQGSRRPGKAMVMSATIWKQFDLSGSLVCCADLFEISHRNQPYVMSPMSKPGDSGAAVTKDAASDQWLGMLMGGHRSSSFVCYAAHIMDWASDVVPGIRLYP